MVGLAVVLAAAAAALCGAPRARPRPPSAAMAAVQPGASRRSLPVPVVAGVAGALAAVAVVPMPVALPAAAVAAAVATRMVGRLEPASVRRRRMRLEAMLPHVVDLMSTCLAAGGSPAGALREILTAVEGPMRDELGTFVAKLALGADVVSVWRAMAAHPQLGALGRALARSAETGASVADALDRLAGELRSDRRASLEAAARTIEVKASLPLGLCLLPAFVLIGIVPMIAGSFSLTFLDR